MAPAPLGCSLIPKSLLEPRTLTAFPSLPLPSFLMLLLSGPNTKEPTLPFSERWSYREETPPAQMNLGGLFGAPSSESWQLCLDPSTQRAACAPAALLQAADGVSARAAVSGSWGTGGPREPGPRKPALAGVHACEGRTRFAFSRHCV